MAWYDSIIDFIKDVPDNYKKYKDIVDVGGSAAKAYLDYKNQKARNELEESAYTDYMKAAEAAGQEAQAAIDLNLTPMTVTGRPTSKADVTSFQKVAQGGIIGLKNGGDPNAGITALRKKAPDVVKAMGFNKGGGPGIEALRKKAPDVVKRMGFDEGSPDTVMFGMDGGGDLSFPKIEGKSDEYAILSGLFNDVDGKVDEQTKMQYYKTLIPYVYKNGDISKTEYDAMIEEVIVNKAKGGIANLKNGGRPGYMMGEGPVMDGTVKIEDAVQMASDKYDPNDPMYNGINKKIVIEFIEEGIPLGYDTPEEYYDDFYGIIGKNKNSNIEDRNKDSAEMFKIIKGAAKGGIINLKKGGRVKRAAGGVMDLGGMEKDYRFNGGFVPLGEYEKKDDVPARLSKNEFVFTADAVRAAGGGSINKGAQKMYDTMKTLEAQPTAKRMTA
jgi:ribosomal protein S20